MSSDEDSSDLMASFKRGNGSASAMRKQASVSPGMFFSEEESSAGENHAPTLRHQAGNRRVAVAVKVPPVRNRSDYTYYEPKQVVHRILREYTRKGEIMYEVELPNGRTRQATFDALLDFEGGSSALQAFQNEPTPSADDSSSSAAPAPKMRPGLRNKPKRAVEEGMVDSAALDISEDELAFLNKPRRGRVRNSSRSRTGSRRSISLFDFIDTSDEDDDTGKRRRKRKQPQEPTRRSSRARAVPQAYDDEDEDDTDGSSSIDILRSDITQGQRKRKRPGRPPTKPEKIPRAGVRASGRSTRTQNNMQEANVNDIYRSDSEPRSAAPKVVNVREAFETLPRSNLFRSRHVEGCETCGDGPTLAPLIYCQGCSLSYHKNCLGTRSSRDHLVTKVGHENFVLQCKRCINFYKRKDPIAPDLAKCQDCHRPGPACRPFKARKTALQEQKEREDNGGHDPITNVPDHLVNNAANVLFRCTGCARAWHYHHLPPLSQYAMVVDRDEDEMADERFQEYSRKWVCQECDDTQKQKVSAIIAWRPSDVDSYRPGTSCEELSEDDKQYLLKWENQSYFRATWHSGAWTWGVTAPQMRKSFFKREDGPKMRTEDAIPEEFLRIDIVLDVKFTSYVEIRSEEIDKARIKEVDQALIKYKSLGYEDAVWEKVPTPEDGDRWLDFVTAYEDWVAGRYVKYPKQGPLKARLEKARGTPFSKLEREKQPENLEGGELMKYQVEGLNWLYYQWYSQKNCILADEMGLGKTIQVIGFMATLIQEHSCFPFLIVVPNSTCANWRREIKQWAPKLRVVTYFGSAAARDMAHKYELFPHGQKELRCHIVVTSYEAAADDSCRRFFRSISWAGLIVDEGQRLKNDKSILYGALSAVRAPFRLLLTGTPLQNNARELFNLLQFLDENINAAELEEKYTEMTSENIRELHDQIRPYILRRTKVQVLTFLPPLGQIIVPISMSHLQKKLYKSILAKNPELLKALFVNQTLKQQDRANLNNILMQLRKCLCHPFVYSREIEERTDIAAVSHRNLVEASAKLHLLEILLPKLKEGGHRVLIFSQFLDMLSILEDFLDGLQLSYQRLDGTMGSLEKQKRIDHFNAPDSSDFAFLLSTRAGGVGINLATADTVIILDPDFNPHQDIQAISRAHRIGQKKKVLCFQLMTRASVEERIVQIGRKKMALDHVVVEQLDADDFEEKDVQSILKHGAAELFKDEGADHDIRYDEASIDKLIDRTQIENTKASGDDSAETQFSFARVWANDQGALEDTIDAPADEEAPDPGVWDKILKERQAVAAREALARADALGKGRRARATVNYNTEQRDVAGADKADVEDLGPESPIKVDKGFKKHKNKTKNKSGSDSDTDFQVSEDESSSEEEPDTETMPESLPAPAPVSASASAMANMTNIIKTSKSPMPFMYKQNNAGTPPFSSLTLGKAPNPAKRISTPAGLAQPKGSPCKSPRQKSSSSEIVDLTEEDTGTNGLAVKPFARVQLPIRSPLESTYGQYNNVDCRACRLSHAIGACPLKVAGVEHCGLCGLAHFGIGRTCPHIRSETQVRDMLQALKNSPEKKELVEIAAKYLRGVKGTLVQQKKKDRERAMLQGPGSIGADGLISHPFERPAAQNTTQANSNVARTSAHFQGQNGQYQGPPQREVPLSQPYNGPVHAAPGSVGSHIRAPAPQQVQQGQQQRPQPGSAAGNPQNIDDHAVESALRGFLGR